LAPRSADVILSRDQSEVPPLGFRDVQLSKPISNEGVPFLLLEGWDEVGGADPDAGGGDGS
jgi:hypothetical protein